MEPVRPLSQRGLARPTGTQIFLLRHKCPTSLDPDILHAQAHGQIHHLTTTGLLDFAFVLGKVLCRILSASTMGSVEEGILALARRGFRRH